MLRKGLAGVEQISGEGELGSGDVPETVSVGEGFEELHCAMGERFWGSTKEEEGRERGLRGEVLEGGGHGYGGWCFGDSGEGKSRWPGCAVSMR